MKKYLIFLVVAVGLIFVGYPLKAAETSTSTGIKEKKIKIGVVNFVKIISESNAGIEANKEINSLRQIKQENINKKRQALEKLQQEIIKGSFLSEEARSKKEIEIQDINKDLQRMVEDSNEEINKINKELLDVIVRKIQVIINTMAKEEGFTLILESSQTPAIVYRDDYIDVTDKIVERYNKDKKSTK